MDDSQDSRDDAGPDAQGAGGGPPGGRSGQGAESALRHVIADSRRQEREDPGAPDTGDAQRH